RRRALITGCGALSAFGVGVDAFWKGIVSGRSALRPIESFDASECAHAAAGEIRGLPADAAERIDRIGQYASAAAQQALTAADLDLDDVDRTRVGVILGTTLGAMAIGEEYLHARHGRSDFRAH